MMQDILICNIEAIMLKFLLMSTVLVVVWLHCVSCTLEWLLSSHAINKYTNVFRKLNAMISPLECLLSRHAIIILVVIILKELTDEGQNFPTSLTVVM